MKIRIAFAAGTALMLAACSGSEPTPEPTPANDVLPESEVLNDTTLNMAEPLPLDTPTPAPTPTADPATTGAVETQMMDDADATGMTARVNRDESTPADTSSEQQPAEEKK